MEDQQFDPELDPDVSEFGTVVHAAIRDTGGFDVVMRSEVEPKIRKREIEPLLEKLGVFDLDPTGGQVQLQAAATACRAAGTFALPYPLAERLAASTVPQWAELSVPAAIGAVSNFTAEPRPLINMGDVDLAWHAVDGAGRVRELDASAAVCSGSKLGPFVAALTVSDKDLGESPMTLATVTHLQSCTLLGMLESALELAVTYAGDRSQFGAPIVTYQAIQHQLAEALTAIELLERHVLYGLWSLANHRANALVDVLGARVEGLRAADVVLRVGHQVHGATGFCDESAISWISRHSQPLRRLPWNRPQAERWLTELILRSGFDGIFTSRVPVGSADGLGKEAPS